MLQVQARLRGPGQRARFTVIADRSVAALADGANDEGYHLVMNWGRDLPGTQVADIHNVVAAAKPGRQGVLEYHP